jgi:hypothetical protein
VALAGVSTKLLAFHLDVLEEVVVTVPTSQGDARRFVRPRPERLPAHVHHVVFACTADSARNLDITQRHWSVPNPVGGHTDEFSRTCDVLPERIDRLTRAVPAA